MNFASAAEPRAKPPLLGQCETPSPSRGVTAGWWLGGLLLVVLLGIAVLYAYSPEEFAFYPRCGLFALTGLHCPGCGSLRAMHHLTHGRIGAALDENALFVIGLALTGGWCAGRLIRRKPLKLRAGSPSLRSLLLLLALGVLFGVLRNLPWYPFVILAP